MPTQIMVTRMKKTEIQQEIASLGAADLLTVGDGPDAGTFLVMCQKDGLRNKEGSAEALQRIADIDSRRVRAEAKTTEPELELEDDDT